MNRNSGAVTTPSEDAGRHARGAWPAQAALRRAITDDELSTYRRDGAVVLRGVMPSDWLDHLRHGFATLESHFGPDALIERPRDGKGRYVNEQAH